MPIYRDIHRKHMDLSLLGRGGGGPYTSKKSKLSLSDTWSNSNDHWSRITATVLWYIYLQCRLTIDFSHKLQSKSTLAMLIWTPYLDILCRIVNLFITGYTCHFCIIYISNLEQTVISFLRERERTCQVLRMPEKGNLPFELCVASCLISYIIRLYITSHTFSSFTIKYSITLTLGFLHSIRIKPCPTYLSYIHTFLASYYHN